MKKISTIIALCCAVALLALPQAMRAQTITLDSVSATTFCEGGSISVIFTATGMWQHNNAFSIQLSDASGSFSNGYSNLGAVKDTAPGTFTITSSIPDAPGTHYRVRVSGAYPYTLSADNGTDITIAGLPGAGIYESTGTVLVGDTVVYSAGSNNRIGDSYFWDFGDGAIPATSTDSTVAVWYSTTGAKPAILTVTSPFGCQSKAGSGPLVYGCNPAVPSDSYIDSTNFYVGLPSVNIWVVPGATANYDIEMCNIFAEPNSSVVGCLGCVVYLKDGATFSEGEDCTVIYSPGAGINKASCTDCTFLECNSLTFDYSKAPPNSIMHINDGSDVVNANIAPAPIEIALSPNPTNGIVAVEGVPLSAQVQVMNVLGVAVQQMARITASDFTLDLSTLAAGTYYVRIASGNGVTTKKVVKE